MVHDQLSQYPRPSRDYEKTFHKFKNHSVQCAMPNSKVTPRHFSSVKSISELDQILLGDLQVNRIHCGRYLKCQLVSDSIYNAGFLTCLISDSEKKDLEYLRLCHRDLLFSGRDLRAVFVKGAKFSVKEPFLREENRDVFISVESPTDIDFLKFEDDLK